MKYNYDLKLVRWRERIQFGNQFSLQRVRPINKKYKYQTLLQIVLNEMQALL